MFNLLASTPLFADFWSLSLPVPVAVAAIAAIGYLIRKPAKPAAPKAEPRSAGDR